MQEADIIADFRHRVHVVRIRDGSDVDTGIEIRDLGFNGNNLTPRTVGLIEFAKVYDALISDCKIFISLGSLPVHAAHKSFCQLCIMPSNIFYSRFVVRM